jgi:HTH-type transcriptional regulator, sugar sensing transcriptional regulator
MDSLFLIMNDMKQLGFSEYECKAYLKLLEDFPLTGYTLAKHSGIPRSRIYDVLDNLTAKQMVFVQEEKKNKLYYPIEPDIFINKTKAHYEGVFSNISKFSSKLYQGKKQDDKLVVIRGRKGIINFLKVLINGAQKRISMSIWEEELNDITEELNLAMEKGVALRGMYFGENSPFETLVPHRRLKRYFAEKKERYMSVIIDGTHVVSGVVSRGEDSKVNWTQDEGFIEVSEDYIAHDLVVNLYSASLGKEAKKKFEAFSDNIQKHYYDYSDEEFKKLMEVESEK